MDKYIKPSLEVIELQAEEFLTLLRASGPQQEDYPLYDGEDYS